METESLKQNKKKAKRRRAQKSIIKNRGEILSKMNKIFTVDYYLKEKLCILLCLIFNLEKKKTKKNSIFNFY